MSSLMQIVKLFKKKPIPVEAVQYTGNNFNDLYDWSGGAVYREPRADESCPSIVKVATLEGTSYNVTRGYWIIKGVKGEFYPCDPNIFAETYEEVVQ